MLEVIAIPAFSDNYIWCIINKHSNEAIVVDPGCSQTVLNFLEKLNLELVGILITHHHPDHIGGVVDLKDQTNTTVFGYTHAGPKGRKLDFIDKAFNHGDSFSILGTDFQVIEIPGHTLDHIAFYSAQDQTHLKPWLFCGDTLFSGGCGRLFEGSPSQMHNSLNKLSKFPKETEVYCAHEYTLSNLEFALSLMPNNPALQTYIEVCKVKRSKGQATLPSTIKQELLCNPFLRTNDQDLINNLAKTYKNLSTDAVSIFTATRKAKDHF